MLFALRLFVPTVVGELVAAVCLLVEGLFFGVDDRLILWCPVQTAGRLGALRGFGGG